MNSKTRYITALAMGIALYVALSYAVNVPIYQNYYICLGYVVLSVFAWYYGAVGGAVVGTLGCVLYCLLIQGLRGMPGWALGNLFIGIALGIIYRALKKLKPQTAIIIGAAAAVFTSFIGILIIKSFVEVFIKAQPMVLRMMTNFSAFVADAVVLLLGVPICLLLRKPFANIGVNDTEHL